LRRKIVEQTRSIGGWSIIVTQSPRILSRACCNVRWPGALTASPPADRSVGDDVWVGWATAWKCWWDIWDWDARVLDFLDPLRNFGRVCGWDYIQGRIT
jgi:hypothetical protein